MKGKKELLKRYQRRNLLPQPTWLLLLCLQCFLGLHMESISPGNFNRDHFEWIIAWQQGFYIDPLIMSITDSDNSELFKCYTSARNTHNQVTSKTAWVTLVLQDLLRPGFLCSLIYSNVLQAAVFQCSTSFCFLYCLSMTLFSDVLHWRDTEYENTTHKLSKDNNIWLYQKTIE